MSVLLLLLAPLGVLLACARLPVLDRIGAVPVTFALGFAVALLAPTGLWPEGMQQTVAEVSVALALPLIIFAANIRRALADARGALTAIALAFVAVVIAALAGTLLFAPQIPAMPQVAALAVGAYTGSGMNMGAINTAIGGDTDIFLTMITYDIVFSVIYMAVVLLIGQRLAGLLLPAYRAQGAAAESDMDHLADDSARAYGVLLRRDTLRGTGLALLAAVLVVGAGVALASPFPEATAGTITLLVITTLGLVGSLLPTLHRIRTSFPLGMYLILVFCFASATLLDTKVLTEMDPAIGGFFLTVIFGALILHALLCRVAGVDRDTYLVASGAAIMSVPFIPVIAGALKNRALVVPGIAIAIIGYALGNYLGVLVHALVRALTG